MLSLWMICDNFTNMHITSVLDIEDLPSAAGFSFSAQFISATGDGFCSSETFKFCVLNSGNLPKSHRFFSCDILQSLFQ